MFVFKSVTFYFLVTCQVTEEGVPRARRAHSDASRKRTLSRRMGRPAEGWSPNPPPHTQPRLRNQRSKSRQLNT
eukprot:7751889-Pyramimonas_sp.AAC.1